MAILATFGLVAGALPAAAAPDLVSPVLCSVGDPNQEIQVTEFINGVAVCVQRTVSQAVACVVGQLSSCASRHASNSRLLALGVPTAATGNTLSASIQDDAPDSRSGSCWDDSGVTFDWCQGIADQGGGADSFGYIYGVYQCGCRTSGTIHVNLKNGFDGDPYDGIWTFYTQLYSGVVLGCPDSNQGCNYGTSGQDVDRAVGTMGDAVFNYNPRQQQGFQQGSPCHSIGGGSYQCDGAGGYGAFVHTSPPA
ncbi:MAG TPA: hypothetical protein VM241_08945 [Candidatus Thermoplasmatota archaeon]|nr:hypothetical protein [Candidatus Thermoplasmatota archaeon]